MIWLSDVGYSLRLWRRHPSLVAVAGFVELGVCKRLVGREREASLPLGWQLSEEVRLELGRQARNLAWGAAPVP